jgi:hypothetical protein
MSGGYEAEGIFEGGRVIRLKEPLPYKDQLVKVIVTPQTETANLRERNRLALAALDRLLAEPDDMTTEQWMELEKVIEEHPLRIRKDVAS